MRDIAVLDRELLAVKEVAEKIACDKLSPKKVKDSAIKTYFQIKCAVDTYRQEYPKQEANARNNKDIPYTSINEYKKALENKSVLSIAFGASLMDDIDQVKLLSEKMPVMCSDVAVSWLIGKGIYPRYITCLDANIPAERVPEYDMDGVTVFCSIAANNNYVMTCYNQGATIVFFSTECRIGTHLELARIANVPECLPISGNVSFGQDYICLSVMNCNKLYIAAHDYCFSFYYYPDAFYPGDLDKDIMEKRILQTLDKNQDAVYTSIQLMLYKDFFLDYLYATGLNKKVINLSNYGLLNI